MAPAHSGRTRRGAAASLERRGQQMREMGRKAIMEFRMACALITRSVSPALRPGPPQVRTDEGRLAPKTESP